MYIGRSNMPGNANLDGYIDDFAMYNVGLVSSEIYIIYL